MLENSIFWEIPPGGLYRIDEESGFNPKRKCCWPKFFQIGIAWGFLSKAFSRAKFGKVWEERHTCWRPKSRGIIAGGRRREILEKEGFFKAQPDQDAVCTGESPAQPLPLKKFRDADWKFWKLSEFARFVPGLKPQKPWWLMGLPETYLGTEKPGGSSEQQVSLLAFLIMAIEQLLTSS